MEHSTYFSLKFFFKKYLWVVGTILASETKEFNFRYKMWKRLFFIGLFTNKINELSFISQVILSWSN
jgi:hypothetical protein